MGEIGLIILGVWGSIILIGNQIEKVLKRK